MTETSAQEKASTAEQAERAYATLRSLVPGFDQAARQELLTAGVPIGQVAELYPLDFDALALALIDHYQRTGLDRLKGLPKLAGDHRFKSQRNRQSWQPSLRKHWLAQHPGNRAYSDSVWELIYFLRDQVANDSWYDFVAVLWDTWWMMANRAVLPQEAQAFADKSMLWIQIKALPNLGQI